MSASITVRDRRTLPFFMVRLRALQEIRNSISGPRRARALGLYTLLCQMANEQRDVGEQLRVTATYRELTGRGGVSAKTLKVLLLALRAANAARHEIRVDPLQGSMPSLLHLPTQDGPWVGVTVSMAARLAAQTAIPVLPALGLLAVLLEFCDEQREAHGGQLAETTRANVALRVGCGVDTLDTWAKALQDAGVLTITRRRGHGGANLPNIWEITEASQQPAIGDAEAHADQGPQTDTTMAESGPHPPGVGDTPGPRHDITMAEAEQHPPGVTATPGPTDGDALADSEQHPGGKSATAVSDERPINGRGGDQAEGLTPENSFPPTPTGADRMGEAHSVEIEELCEYLAASLSRRATPAILRRPGGWAVAGDTWRTHAAIVLADIDLARARRAVDYLEGDTVLGSQIRTMQALAKRLDEILLRVAATDQRNGAASRSPARANGGAPPWAQAQQRIQDAIRRHGAGGSAAARRALADVHPAYAVFVDSVGWTSLCRDDPQRRQWDWQQAWKQACDTASDSTEEAA